MTNTEIKNRLLLLARDRLQSNPSAFSTLQREIRESIKGQAMLLHASALPVGTMLAAEMGNSGAWEEIDSHLLGLIDQWATGCPVPAPSAEPLQQSARPSLPLKERPIAKADDIPGKMPNTTIGKLAIKAAWKIECGTGKRAAAKQVIETLQSWVDHKDNHEAVAELTEKIPNGVKWVTSAGKKNNYDIGACQKTLETWNKSRA